CRERRKRVNADKRLSGQRLSVSACRPVEHPCRNFPPTFCLRPIQRAAKDDIVSLLDGLMNANSATKPRMMPIKNLAKNGPVGVLKRCCTMGPARIYPWRKMRRSRAPSIAPGTFFVAQSWADCITNIAGFNLRQAQSFDHFVGAQQDRVGEFGTERFRSSHAYYQLELGWLFDGEICWLRTPENFVYIGGRTAIHIIDVWSIGDEATNIDKIARFVNRRKSLFNGELDDARPLTEGKGIDE